MLKKYFVFALVFLIAQQGLSDAKYVAFENETRNLWEDALQALKELKEKLHNLVQNTLEELHHILDEFKQEAEQIIEEAKQLIHEEILKIIKEIERIKEEAEALGADIAECIEEQKGEVEALEERIILELVACVTNKVHEVEQIVTDTVNEIQDVVKAYQELEGKLEACQGDARDLHCVTNVLKEIAEKTLSLPKFIRQQVVKAKKLIANLHKDLRRCAFEKVAIIPAEGAKIVANFNQCVRDKINSENEERGVVQDALQALQELKENLENLIQESQAKLEEILDHFKQQAAEILEQAKQEIHDEIVKILEKIQQIKDEAEALGADISECLKEQEEKVKELEKLIIEELVKCVTDKIEEAVAIVSDTVREVKDVIQEYKDLKDKLEACRGKDEKDVKCVLEVLKEIIGKSVNLPVFIAKQVAKAERLIKNLKADLLECALDKAVIAAEGGSRIVEDFVQCVRDKLHPNEIH